MPEKGSFPGRYSFFVYCRNKKIANSCNLWANDYFDPAENMIVNGNVFDKGDRNKKRQPAVS